MNRPSLKKSVLVVLMLSMPRVELFLHELTYKYNNSNVSNNSNKIGPRWGADFLMPGRSNVITLCVLPDGLSHNFLRRGAVETRFEKKLK